MTAINGKGWFVHTVSALVSGVAPEMVANPWNIKMFKEYLFGLSDGRISRLSRKGWDTIEHQDIGTLQWKIGVSPFKGYYFFLRVNGRPVLEQTGYQGSTRIDDRPFWTAPHTPPEVKLEVEEWLRREE